MVGWMLDCQLLDTRVEHLYNKHVSMKVFISGPKQLLQKCAKQTISRRVKSLGIRVIAVNAPV